MKCHECHCNIDTCIDWFYTEMPQLSQEIKRQLSDEFKEKWLTHFYCKNCKKQEYEKHMGYTSK